MNIPKHVINKKIHAKDLKINMKWILKDKNLQQSHHLKLLKFIYIHEKFQCISLINSSFDGGFIFHTSLTYFLSSHFFVFLCGV
jgi:hypothetical protein